MLYPDKKMGSSLSETGFKVLFKEIKSVNFICEQL